MLKDSTFYVREYLRKVDQLNLKKKTPKFVLTFKIPTDDNSAPDAAKTDSNIVSILKNGTTSPHIITTIPEQAENTSLNEPSEEPLLVNGNGDASKP